MIATSPALVLLATATLATADILTTTEGKKLPAEVGLIGKEKVQVTVNGKSVLMDLTSFDGTTQKYLKALAEKRAAKASLTEAEKAAAQAAEALRRAEAERTLPERAVRGMASAGGLKGLWVGMSEEDVLLTAKGSQWTFVRKDLTVTLTPSEWARSDEGKKALEDFTTLAKDEEGAVLTWDSIVVRLHEGKAWEVAAFSALRGAKEGSVVPWFNALRSADQKKYGKPSLELNGEKLSKEVDPSQKTLWRAEWKHGGQYAICAAASLSSDKEYLPRFSLTYCDREAEKLANFKL